MTRISDSPPDCTAVQRWGPVTKSSPNLPRLFFFGPHRSSALIPEAPQRLSDYPQVPARTPYSRNISSISLELRQQTLEKQ